MDFEFFWMGGMWIMPLMMFFFFVLVVVFIFIISSGTFKRMGPCHRETSLDLLKKRYARGEISREEYLQMKKDIES